MKLLSRSLRLLCCATLLVFGLSDGELAAAQGAAVTTIPVGPGSLTGIWQNAEYKFTGLPPRERTLRASDGAAPPFLPWAADLLEKRLKDADQGKIFGNTLTECLPGGVPEMLFGAAYPIQILETPGQITMLFEEQNHFRTIVLDGRHAKDPDPSYMGDSVGHWAGDTLVVDTVALNDRTTLDMVGTPHTAALHVVERYRRVAMDKIEIRVMIEDKGAFSKPWETKTTWHAAIPGTQLSEYICENNRNAPDANGHTTFGASRN